jgi:hypothetical protein
MSGWVRLHRGWRESEFFSAYRQTPFSEREAWLWLIENAAWKDTERSAASGQRVTITRGQIHTSLRGLQTAWGWDKSRVERFLKRLTEWSMIEMDAGKEGRTLTLCNYCRFQSSREGDETPSEKETGRQRDTQEEDKKNKKEERKIKDGFALPDWCDADAWADWEQQRNELKMPMTDKARQLAVGILKKSVAEGFTVRETIDLAITNGWRGLFVPKGRSSSGSAQSSDLLSGLTFSAAKEKLIDLENAAEVMSTILTGEQDATWERYMAKRVAARQFRAAFEAKWPPRKDGVN